MVASTLKRDSPFAKGDILVEYHIRFMPFDKGSKAFSI
jgi:hypothetical protein